MTLSLKDVPDASVVDGSWRDLYVLGTCAADWNSMLAWVATAHSDGVRFTVDDQVRSLPATIQEILPLREVASPLLCVDLSGLDLRCHFFGDGDIEFDLDPRELSEARFQLLLEFMLSLGRRLSREVRLAPENSPEITILWYDPERDRVMKG